MVYFTEPTATVGFCYDGKIYAAGVCTATIANVETGQLTSVGTVDSSRDYAHDLAGRMLLSTQNTTGLAAKPFTYQYLVSDFLSEVGYPSGRKVVTCPNGDNQGFDGDKDHKSRIQAAKY